METFGKVSPAGTDRQTEEEEHKVVGLTANEKKHRTGHLDAMLKTSLTFKSSLRVKLPVMAVLSKANPISLYPQYILLS